jgi:Cu-processing system permease protein
MRVVITIARRELRETLRNRWLLAFAIGFALLALALSRAGFATAGYSGLGGFGRTAASLINALVLFVPLIGLSLGAHSICGERERGTLTYLLANPVSRHEVFLGKALGLAAALAAALAGGFGAAALALAAGGADQLGAFLILAAYTLLLALVSLGFGLWISTVARTVAGALGAALIVWLGLAFLGDLGLVTWTIAFHPSPRTLLPVVLANPLQLFKLGAIYGLRSSLDPLGAVGQYAALRWGRGLPWILFGLLTAWASVALFAAQHAFRRRPL